MHYDNENCDTEDLNGEIDWTELSTFSTTDIDMGDGTKIGITDIQGEVSGTIEMVDFPAAIQLQYFYNNKWHDRETAKVRKRDYVISRWKITEADGSVRYTDTFVLTICHRPPWYVRFIAYFRRKREQRKQSETKRG